MTARTCPMCGKTVDRAVEAVLPFCSRSCKLADLGRWLEGSYRIPGPPLEIENERIGPNDLLPGSSRSEEP